MTTTTEEYKKLKEEIRELRRQATEKGKAVFQDGFKNILADHPVLEKVSWIQYTPYFNDGDPCVFGAEVDVIYINGDDDENEFVGYGLDKKENGPLDTAGLAVLAFLKVFDDEDYLGMFGDHARVVVTKEGIEVEEYEHD